MNTALRTRPSPAVFSADTTERECSRAAADLIHARQTVLPKRLLAPGPEADQLQALLGAAAAAPDHGRLLPWRLVIVPRAERTSLGEVFAQALHERDATATPEQLAQAREKAHRAPLLLLVVVDGQCGDPAVNLAERILSAGCAVQNMLLMATAMGFGSALTSGKALGSTALRQRFGLRAGELATCFMSVGTVEARRPARVRPTVADYCNTLAPHNPAPPEPGDTMNIQTFDDLLSAARMQPLPQRLLFVFAGVELPQDATPAQRLEFERGEGGALVPQICVDKGLDELQSFDQLVHEAEAFGKPWGMVFAAALAGKPGREPGSAEAEQPLHDMVEAIRQGRLGAFIPFDLQGHAVVLN